MNVDSNWVSAIVATAALAVSIAAHRSAEKSKVRTAKLEERNSALAESQAKLAHHSWSDEYFRDLTQWACQMVSAISSAIHLVGLELPNERRQTLIDLSACIDMGRWYFPNRHEDHYGQEKQPAYRGFRQPLLDWAVRAYDVCRDERSVSDPRGELVICQRQFVSAVQEYLDPRSREAAIRKILANFGPVAGLPKVESPKQE